MESESSSPKSKKVTMTDIGKKYRKQEKLVMLTATDYASARLVDHCTCSNLPCMVASVERNSNVI